MGLKTGIKNFFKHKTLKNLIKFLQSHKKFKDRIPPHYFEAVEKVHGLFLHQTVYDPYSQKCCPLTPIPEGKEIDQSFIGNYVSEENLPKYIKGHLNKYTMEDREIYDPDISRIVQDMKGNDITLNTFYYLNKHYDFTKKAVENDSQHPQDSGHKGNLCCI